MYAKVLGAGIGAGGTVLATVLPNTGSNMIVEIAISVAAGLGVWGIMSRNR
jgi:LPXTG-motif cell wall-anchored protein